MRLKGYDLIKEPTLIFFQFIEPPCFKSSSGESGTFFNERKNFDARGIQVRRFHQAGKKRLEHELNGTFALQFCLNIIIIKNKYQ